MLQPSTFNTILPLFLSQITFAHLAQNLHDDRQKEVI